MEIINEIAVVKVSIYQGENAEPDKNGEDPVYLSLLAGVMPNRNIISGTIAKREGMLAGGMYLVHVTEGKVDKEYGRQFSISRLEDLEGVKDLYEGLKALGKPTMVFIPKAGVAVTEEEMNEEETEES